MKRFNQAGKGKGKKKFTKKKNDDKLRFDNALIIDFLPGGWFRLEVPVIKDGEQKDVLKIVANLSSKLKKIGRKSFLAKHDTVEVEVNPIDMYYDQENNILKGTITYRK